MKRKPLVLILLAAFIIFIAGCGSKNTETVSVTESVSETVEVPEVKTAPEKTTIMIYMIGSDLESKGGAATEDISEITQSGVDVNRVNILLYTGGCSDWYSDINVSSEENCLFHLTANGFEQVSSSPDMSMGDPENLTNFLNYAYSNYKADSYDLILWDHGNGPVMGYGLDKTHGNDSLTLLEIKSALEASPFGTDNKLNFIGFDACLMSSAELAVIVSDYADYLIASQETEPSFGWNYNFLPEVTNVEESALPTVIIDTYIDYCVKFNEDNPFFSSDVTLAVMDLSKAGELYAAIEDLFAKASVDISGEFNNLAKDRVASRDVGRASTGSDYDLVDISDLAENMDKHYPNEVAKLKSVLSSMVVYNKTNTVKCEGMSIYYPFYNKNYYDYKWRDDYAELGVFPNYVNYLSKYELIWLSAPRDNYGGTVLTPDQVGEQTFTLKLTEDQTENYASARYYILKRESGDVYQPVYIGGNVVEEDGILSVDFNGKIIYMTDDYGRGGIPYMQETDTIDGVMYLSTFAYLADGTSIDRTLSFDTPVYITLTANAETEEVKISSVYEMDDESSDMVTGKRKEINYNKWTWMKLMLGRRYFLERDENGNILPFSEWTKDGWISWYECAYKENGFCFKYEPLADDGEEYFLCFEVMDVQGNKYGSELLPVAVARNEGSDSLQINAVIMEDENKKPIMENDDFGLYAVLSRNVKSGEKMFYLYADNKIDNQLMIGIENIVVDGRYVFKDSVLLMPYGGYSDTDVFEELRDYCREMGIDYPQNIYFELTVTDDVSGKIYCMREPYIIGISEDVSSDLVFTEIGQFSAGNQVLVDNDELKVTLMGAGNLISQCSRDKVYFLYEVENKTENLMYFDVTTSIDGYDKTADSTLTVPGGYKGYILDSVGLISLENLFSDPGKLEPLKGVKFGYRFGLGGRSEADYTKLSIANNGGDIHISTSDKVIDNRTIHLLNKDGIELFNERGLRIVLKAHYSEYYDFDDNIWWLEVTNSGNSTMGVYCNHLRVNGKYMIYNYQYVMASPGETAYYDVDMMSLVMMLADEEIETVRYMTAFENEQGVNQGVDPDNNSQMTVGFEDVTALGASTGTHVIKESDGIKISVIRAGGRVTVSGETPDNFDILFEIENQSDEARQIQIQGYSINGVFVNNHSSVLLPAGCTTLISDQIRKDKFETSEITGINNMSVLFTILPAQHNTTEAEKQGEEWFFVPLDKKASNTQKNEHGRLLWSENNVSVYCVGDPVVKDYTDSSCWTQKLLIVNDSDLNIYLETGDRKVDGQSAVGSPYMNDNRKVGAHTVSYATVNVFTDVGKSMPESAEFTFLVKSLDETKMYFKSSDVIKLSLK